MSRLFQTAATSEDFHQLTAKAADELFQCHQEHTQGGQFGAVPGVRDVILEISAISESFLRLAVEERAIGAIAENDNIHRALLDVATVRVALHPIVQSVFDAIADSDRIGLPSAFATLAHRSEECRGGFLGPPREVVGASLPFGRGCLLQAAGEPVSPLLPVGDRGFQRTQAAPGLGR